jgi:hypothetical protein
MDEIDWPCRHDQTISTYSFQFRSIHLSPMTLFLIFGSNKSHVLIISFKSDNIFTVFVNYASQCTVTC